MKTMILFTLTLFAWRADAQIRGMIRDSSSGNLLGYTTIRLLNKEAKINRTTLADSTGYFVFTRVSPGQYTMHFSMTGYRLHTKVVLVTDTTGQQVINIFLNKDAKHLQGITVIAQRPVVTPRIDGFHYDATADVQAAGEHAGDLLRKLPGVQVDASGTPTMRGSSRIKVFIDGRPSESYAPTIIEVLRQISADNVARVEIITEPSARYDGEGVDGVINIFLKRPLSDGASGNINAFTGNRNTQVSPTITIRKRQWLINSDAGYYFSTNEVITKRRRLDKTGGNDVFQEQQTGNKAVNKSVGLGFTRILDSLTTLNIGGRYGHFHDKSETEIGYLISNRGLPKDEYTRLISNPFTREIGNFNTAFIRKSIDRSAEFSVIGYYFNQQINNDYSLRQRSYYETNDNNTGNKELAVQTDYVKQFKNKNNLEIGVKTMFRRFSNNSIFQPDEGRSAQFYFPRDIWAAYSGYQFSAMNWKFRVGARYEQTILSIKSNDTSLRVPDYKNLLPNLLVSRTFKVHQFSFAYSRKLFRPYLAMLNPVVSYIDSLNLSYGNPYLDPSISNNYDLTWTYNKGEWLISTNYFFYQTIRSIESVATLKPSGIIERTYLNVASNNASGVAIQVTFRSKKLTINANGSLRYIDYKGGIIAGTRAGFVANFTTYTSYRLTQTFTLNANFTLNTRRIDLQGFTSGTRYYVFMANKTFKDGKYAVSLRADNLFMPFQTIRETNISDDFDLITDTKLIRRFVRVGFNYRFGRREIRNIPVRTISAEN